MSGPVRALRGAVPLRLLLSFLVCFGVTAWPGTAALAAHTLTGVDVRSDPRGTIVALHTAEGGALGIASFLLKDPPRLVFDLPETQLDPELLEVIQVESPGLAQIRLGQFSLQPDVARMVVDLPEDRAELTWELLPGEEECESLLLLRDRATVVLVPPTVTRSEGAVLVCVAGAGALQRSVGTLGDPARVYADVVGAIVQEQIELDCDQAPLRRLRMAQQEPEEGQPMARIVLELTREEAHTVFSEGRDLVIAVAPRSGGLPLPAYAGSDRLRGRTIVVDPGHGGDDIGAPAGFGPPPRGPYEKDIVLDVGRRLAGLLEAEGASVAMTRKDDTYISLRDRAALANRLRADALISIHCNSGDRPNTLSGTSVYYDHRHSARFAKLVQEELVAELGTEDRGVRNANFAVIRRARGPGILVETAFINHSGDRERLIHPNFRERAARAILRGLIRFLCGESG